MLVKGKLKNEKEFILATCWLPLSLHVLLLGLEHTDLYIFFIKHQRVPRLSSPKINGSSNVNERPPPWKTGFAVLVFRYCVPATMAPLRLNNVPWVSFSPFLGRNAFYCRKHQQYFYLSLGNGWRAHVRLLLLIFGCLPIHIPPLPQLPSHCWIGTNESDGHLASVTRTFPSDSINALHFSLNN